MDWHSRLAIGVMMVVLPLAAAAKEVRGTLIYQDGNRALGVLLDHAEGERLKMLSSRLPAR